MNPADWYDALSRRMSDALAETRRIAADMADDLRLRTELADLIETAAVLRAKRGCRR
jgi:hypothetical protein